MLDIMDSTFMDKPVEFQIKVEPLDVIPSSIEAFSTEDSLHVNNSNVVLQKNKSAKLGKKYDKIIDKNYNGDKRKFPALLTEVNARLPLPVDEDDKICFSFDVDSNLESEDPLNTKDVSNNKESKTSKSPASLNAKFPRNHLKRKYNECKRLYPPAESLPNNLRKTDGVCNMFLKNTAAVRKEMVSENEEFVDVNKSFLMSLLPAVERLPKKERMEFKTVVLNTLSRLWNTVLENKQIISSKTIREKGVKFLSKPPIIEIKYPLENNRIDDGPMLSDFIESLKELKQNDISNPSAQQKIMNVSPEQNISKLDTFPEKTTLPLSTLQKPLPIKERSNDSQTSVFTIDDPFSNDFNVFQVPHANSMNYDISQMDTSPTDEFEENISVSKLERRSNNTIHIGNEMTDSLAKQTSRSSEETFNTTEELRSNIIFEEIKVEFIKNEPVDKDENI